MIGGSPPAQQDQSLQAVPNTNANANDKLLHTTNSQLPGFQATKPNNLVWVGVGGNSQDGNQ